MKKLLLLVSLLCLPFLVEGKCLEAGDPELKRMGDNLAQQERTFTLKYCPSHAEKDLRSCSGIMIMCYNQNLMYEINKNNKFCLTVEHMQRNFNSCKELANKMFKVEIERRNNL